MSRTHPASSSVWNPDLRLAISLSELFIIVGVSAVQIKAIVDTVPISTWNGTATTKISKFWHATMFFIATTLIATYPIILNIVLPADYCGNALKAFVPPYYSVRWALYIVIVYKGNSMDVSNSYARMFRRLRIGALFVAPVLQTIFVVTILWSWNLEEAKVDGKELCISSANHLDSTEVAVISALSSIVAVGDIVIFVASTFSLASPVFNPVASLKLKLEALKHFVAGMLTLSSSLVYFFIFIIVNLKGRFAVIRVDLDYLLLDITVNFILIMASLRTCDSRQRYSTRSEDNRFEMKQTRYKNSRAKQSQGEKKVIIYAREEEGQIYPPPASNESIN